MRAVVWHGVGDIRLDQVKDPTIKDPKDAIVKLTRSVICGTGLHMIRGIMSGMIPAITPNTPRDSLRWFAMV